MVINITDYLANSLLDIFNMDLSYFETAIPITADIIDIMLGFGWALLLGNFMFQAMKSMMSGLGFEGEDPRTLFGRTIVMAFLLVGSRQICDIGLGITKKVIGLLQIPDIVQVPQLSETDFAVPGDASWLLAIIVGVILVVQIVKLFFEIGERYVIVAILTILSPLAFATGGSKNTADIFKGWVRMFASMCLMMILSIVFLKFILSAMSVVPTGVAVIPWCVFVVAIARTGRKIDGIIARIGLNPAITGDPLGHSRIPGMLSYTVVRNIAGSVSKAASANAGGSGRSAAGTSRPTLSSGAERSAAPRRSPIGSGAPREDSSSPTASGYSSKPAEPPIYGEPMSPAGAAKKDSYVGSSFHDTKPERPPIGSSASMDKAFSEKPAATGEVEKSTPAKPSADRPHEVSAADKASSASRPIINPAGTVPHDKPAAAHSAVHKSATAERPVSGLMSGASVFKNSADPAKPATSPAAADARSANTPKASVPSAPRPLADIQPVSTGKSKTSMRPSATAAGAEMSTVLPTGKLSPTLPPDGKAVLREKDISSTTPKTKTANAGLSMRPSAGASGTVRIQSGALEKAVSESSVSGDTVRNLSADFHQHSGQDLHTGTASRQGTTADNGMASSSGQNGRSRPPVEQKPIASKSEDGAAAVNEKASENRKDGMHFEKTSFRDTSARPKYRTSVNKETGKSSSPTRQARKDSVILPSSKPAVVPSIYNGRNETQDTGATQTGKPNPIGKGSNPVRGTALPPKTRGLQAENREDQQKSNSPRARNDNPPFSGKQGGHNR